MRAGEELMAAPPPEPEGNLTDYTVTLRSREELDDFYTDMETEGGNITIPNRAVAVSLRKPISRNTRYWLTAEEAEQVKQDERVLDVIPTEWVGKYQPSQIRDGNWVRGGGQDADHDNWGLVYHSDPGGFKYFEDSSDYWGDDQDPYLYAPNLGGDFSAQAWVSGTGKNVDIIIADGHIDPDHPEFDDGTGTSRVVQYNWFQHDIGSGTGTYTYGTGNYGDNHGAHVAGTAAGNRYGWATDANIYNIYVYGDANGNGDIGGDIWDYIREFHANKPINPNTGRKNPTIVNASFGSAFDFATADFEKIISTTYRGVTTTNAAGLNVTQLINSGINPFNGPKIPVYNTTNAVDVEDTVADGIIVVAAAGNEYARIVDSADQDYNNTYDFVYKGSTFNDYHYHRGTVPGSVPGVICVGAMSSQTVPAKADFSNTGSRIDIFAAGEFINSAINDTGDSTGAGAVADLRDASHLVKKIQGTSMASPQVCGAFACYLEGAPRLTPAEARDSLLYSYAPLYGAVDQFDITDGIALQGAVGKVLSASSLIIRPQTGATYPTKTFKPRTETGVTYPRVKRRRKG